MAAEHRPSETIGGTLSATDTVMALRQRIQESEDTIERLKRNIALDKQWIVDLAPQVEAERRADLG